MHLEWQFCWIVYLITRTSLSLGLSLICTTLPPMTWIFITFVLESEGRGRLKNIILSNGIVTFNEGPSHRRLNLRRAILLWWMVSVMACMLEGNHIQELVSIHICLRNEGKGRLKNFVSMAGHINFGGWPTWLIVELHWKLSINKDIEGGIKNGRARRQKVDSTISGEAGAQSSVTW